MLIKIGRAPPDMQKTDPCGPGGLGVGDATSEFQTRTKYSIPLFVNGELSNCDNRVPLTDTNEDRPRTPDSSGLYYLGGGSKKPCKQGNLISTSRCDVRLLPSSQKRLPMTLHISLGSESSLILQASSFTGQMKIPNPQHPPALPLPPIWVGAFPSSQIKGSDLRQRDRSGRLQS